MLFSGKKCTPHPPALRNTWMASKEFQDTRPIHVIVGGVIVGGVYAEPRMTSRPNSDVQ